MRSHPVLARGLNRWVTIGLQRFCIPRSLGLAGARNWSRCHLLTKPQRDCDPDGVSLTPPHPWNDVKDKQMHRLILPAILILYGLFLQETAIWLLLAVPICMILLDEARAAIESRRGKRLPAGPLKPPQEFGLQIASRTHEPETSLTSSFGTASICKSGENRSPSPWTHA